MLTLTLTLTLPCSILLSQTQISIDTDDLETFLDGGSETIRVKGEVAIGKKPKLSVEIETTKAGDPFYLDTKSAIEATVDSMGDGWKARDFGYTLEGPDLCARYSTRKECRKPASTPYFESCL